MSSSCWRAALSMGLALTLTACGEEEAEPKTCDPECQDAVAARGLRDVIKLVYNLTLQGKPIGPQDAETECPHGGSARVAGFALSNPEQGATEVELGYRFEECAYQHKDDDAVESYSVTISGDVGEQGILAVQPTATTALIFASESLSLEGTVFDPPIDYAMSECSLRLAQDGNHMSGTWCEREIGFDL
jgi:hypothetical protein